VVIARIAESSDAVPSAVGLATVKGLVQLLPAAFCMCGRVL
jgi:hypothetical protein